MTIISAGGAVTGAGSVAATDYQISRSLRFNSADSAFLSRTPASAGNRRTWTWSGWVKRGTLGSFQNFMRAGSTLIRFTNTDTIQFESNSTNVVTSAVFRDPSAWYHVSFAVDTTQATSSNRTKIYVNGVLQILTGSYVTQNVDTDVNNTTQHNVGASVAPNEFINGYLTEIHFIDGQALDETDFGEFSPTTGVWGPIAYTGTYGTNGFYLNFSDNSGVTSTTLGKDQVGSNNWTPNGFSVTAGAGNDSLVDTCTLFGTDTGIGGEVRGNYCTLNAASPLATATANGNLQLNFNATNCVPGTFGVTTGKWYWEGLLTTQTSNQQYFGVANAAFNLSLTVGQDANSWGMTVQSNASNGKAQHNNVESASFATFANGDICMVAYDMDTGKIWFGRNGTFFNSGAPASGTGEIYSNLSGTIVPMLGNKISGGGVLQVNFGQQAFEYTAPSGFKALVTTNLPDPTVIEGDEYFNTVLYTGNGSTQSITGVGFQPDWVWYKCRSDAFSHRVFDVVRGVSKGLTTNSTATEEDPLNGVSAFNADGFTLGADSGGNANGSTFVAWNWKANGAGVSNTAGTISSTVSANTDAGFSIVTYTGTGAASATIGHGLGVAPSMLIVKNRTDGATLWSVYHASVGAGSVAHLNTTAAFSASGDWNSTTPTSTVFSTNNSDRTNKSGSALVAYCFADIPGYSAFGSYTGNGSADGTFVFTGFRPAWVMIKRTDATASWTIFDTTRTTFNAMGNRLFPDTSDAEDSSVVFDITANGFKLRTTNVSYNASGGTYIYMAFAENPFKFALAR